MVGLQVPIPGGAPVAFGDPVKLPRLSAAPPPPAPSPPPPPPPPAGAQADLVYTHKVDYLRNLLFLTPGTQVGLEEITTFGDPFRVLLESEAIFKPFFAYDSMGYEAEDLHFLWGDHGIKFVVKYADDLASALLAAGEGSDLADASRRVDLCYSGMDFAIETASRVWSMFRTRFHKVTAQLWVHIHDATEGGMPALDELINEFKSKKKQHVKALVEGLKKTLADLEEVVPDFERFTAAMPALFPSGLIRSTAGLRSFETMFKQMCAVLSKPIFELVLPDDPHFGSSLLRWRTTFAETREMLRAERHGENLI